MTTHPGDLPEPDLDRLKASLIYLSSRLGNQPDIDQDRLASLLFAVDVVVYHYFNRPFSSAVYLRSTNGVDLPELPRLKRELVAAGDLAPVRSGERVREEARLQPRRKARTAGFSALEIGLADVVVDAFVKRADQPPAQLLEAFSGWQTVPAGKPIPYRDVSIPPWLALKYSAATTWGGRRTLSDF